MSERTKAENKAVMAEHLIEQYKARAASELAGAAGSALSCFDCAWHRERGWFQHVECAYPRERIADVVDLSGVRDGVVLTKDIAATICPAFQSPNARALPRRDGGEE